MTATAIKSETTQQAVKAAARPKAAAAKPAPAPAVAELVLEQLDPKTLIIDTNVRSVADLDANFLADIAATGVRQAITAYRDTDGVHVITGQRRTLGAIKANQATVPVIIQAKPDETGRIVDQVAENYHRKDLSETDTAQAVEQLALIGLPAGQIAKGLSMDKTKVDAALAVAKNAKAKESLSRGIDLEQAMVIAEFAEHPGLVEELEKTAIEEPGRFQYKAQVLRDKLARKAELDERKAEAVAAGMTILDHDPAYSDGAKAATPIRDLTKADGTPLTEEDADAVYFSNYSSVRYAVIDWKAKGFSKNGSKPGGGLTEKQRQERRTVIENGRAWDAAEPVRIAYVEKLLRAKTLPKGAARFAALTLAQTPSATDTLLAAKLLGIKGSLKDHAAKVTTKPETVLLALAISTHEAGLNRQSWRDSYFQVDYTLYMNQLQEWGYTPAPVELIQVKKK